MKNPRSLVFIVLLFCVLMLGSSVNGIAGGGDNNKVFEVQARETVSRANAATSFSAYGSPDFNRQTPLVLDEFQNRFHPANAQRRYSLKISNDTDWDIHRLYMSSAEEDKWGPDQLGDFVLGTGLSFTITDIIAGEYDIMFVDEDSDKCILRNVQVFQNKSWTLSSSWLLKCQNAD